MKRKALLVLAFVVLAAAGGVFWWLEHATRPAPADLPDTSTRSAVFDQTAGAPVTGDGVRTSSAPLGEMPEEGVDTSRPTVPTVGDILAEPDDNFVRVAKKLTAITVNPKAPMEEREEALAHALNLSAGNEAEVLTPLIKDPNLPDTLAETVLAEALNRPLAYQADLYLVALAARKSPQLQTQIREHLAFLTGGEDKGPNPADWAEAIKAAKAEWPE